MRPKIHQQVLVMSALLAAITISGCAAEDTGRASEDASGAHATTEPTGPTDDAGQGTAVLRDARTTADQQNQTCSAPTREPAELESVFDPVIAADGELTIAEVRAVGDGVELVDAEGVVMLGDPHDVGRGGSVAWPLPEDYNRMLPEFDPASRTDLVGMTILDGQNVLPLLRLRAAPDSHLRGLDIDYEWGEGNHEQLFVPLDKTHARQPDGC